MGGTLFDREVSSTVAVAAPVEQAWRALLIVLGAEADVPGVPVAFGAMAGRLRDAVPGDGLAVRARVGGRAYELSAHLVPRGAQCDLTVDAAPDDVDGAQTDGRWHHHQAYQAMKRLVRALAREVSRVAGDAAGPVAR
ncbi:hypothetical protein [Cellulosimicrobium funkei]|uniref:SRPBCC family protein n=1 Tax=Cellulosimicrobium funkei TaxID=264251 RepID=A0A4Y8QXK3_9MICO|nr:hypothetical protein [Cellulosimicrobium funkei]TFF04433.1 hypothetical protein E1O70_18495 [Cellulosimicrobium funkei]TGA67902.1 hypothetical protein EQW79_018295 [Cellulosimicrobium terreum]